LKNDGVAPTWAGREGGEPKVRSRGGKGTRSTVCWPEEEQGNSFVKREVSSERQSERWFVSRGQLSNYALRGEP